MGSYTGNVLALLKLNPFQYPSELDIPDSVASADFGGSHPPSANGDAPPSSTRATP